MSQEAARLYLFSKAYYDCLAAYFGSPLLLTGEFPLADVFRAVHDTLQQILQSGKFPEVAEEFPRQFHSLSPGLMDQPDSEWESGGHEQALKLFVAAQAEYSRAGRPPLTPPESDAALLERAEAAVRQHREEANRRFEAIFARSEAAPPTAERAAESRGPHAVRALREFTQTAYYYLSGLFLGESEMTALQEQLETLEAQAASPEPNTGAVFQSLQTIGFILQGVTENPIAESMREAIDELLRKLG